MKKQIILLMTDTTRCDMLGCYGNESMKTPNLDQLAEEGLRFDKAYSCQPVCGPARSAIFTGIFPHSNGVISNCVPMGANVKTVGQRLHDNGVHCGYIGKWHLDGFDYFGNGECPEGFDDEYWYDMRRYLNELKPEERPLSRNSDYAYDENFNIDFTYGHRVSNRALKFLDQYKDEDFFLTVSYDEPHGPSLCPAPFNTMYDGVLMPDSKNFEDDLSKKPFMQRLWAGKDINAPKSKLRTSNKALSLFLGCNSFADYEIGRVLDKIKEVCPDAMVIYTSDHGDMIGNHRLQTKNGVAYKEICNIPMIFKYKHQGVVSYPASHIDLVPTILDYMGIDIPVLLEGKSMMPQLEDPTIKINDYVYTEWTRYEIDHDGFGGLQPMRAVFDGRYKLAINLMDTDELYDTLEDPDEINNLINDESYSEIRNRLHDAILDNMNRTRDVYRGYQWSCRPWRTDKFPRWINDGYTRQRENEEYEPRQLDYDTGLDMVEAVRFKHIVDEKLNED